MTAPNPRIRKASRRVIVAGLMVLFALTGCKSRGGNGGDVGGAGKRYDPLVYGPRIPPQNVPVRERDGLARDRDPLTTPTSRSDSRGGSGYSDGPDRFKGTFVPNVGSTPAALAAKTHDGDELKIPDTPDNRVPLRPVGGVEIPANPQVSDKDVEPLLAELEKYGVKRENRSLTQEDGKFTFRASMPSKGATLQFTGVGETANEAVKQVLEQVVTERQ